MRKALYRKWRPTTFADVVGQEVITTTLKNQIITQKLTHAYLFTGSRGTGKTTCAKILASAINCLHPKDGNPCGVCEHCKGIEDGSILDVVEMDAASNNKVDDVRMLKEEIHYTPAQLKYRVYIIDEVHMLSTSAFNALLKVMEEPPSYVVFILATTELHKVPATILSRCQRFDFRRIPAVEIGRRLQYIASQEGVQLEESAAKLIGILSDGGMRDAISLLDLCCATADHVTEELVMQIAGVGNQQTIFNVVEAVARYDIGAMLTALHQMFSSTGDGKRITEQLLSVYRDLMVLKTADNPQEILDATADELIRLQQLASQTEMERCIRYITLLSECYDKMNASLQKRTLLEMALIKMAMPQGMTLSQGQNTAVVAPAGATAPMGTTGSVTQTKATQSLPQKPPAARPPTAEAQVRALQPNVSTGAAVPATPADPTNTGTEVANGLATVTVPQENTNNQQAQLSPAEPTVDVENTEEAQAPTSTIAETAKESSGVRVSTSAPEAATTNTQELPREATTPDSNELVLMDTWGEVVSILGKTNPAMQGNLQGTQGYIKGDAVLIEAENQMLFKLLKSSDQARNSVRQAIQDATGRVYKLGPLKKEEKGISAQTNVGESPIDQVISKAKELGVECKE